MCSRNFVPVLENKLGLVLHMYASSAIVSPL